jgi:DNA primase
VKISEQKIDEIRAAANIVDVISESVQLRKRGKNFLGLCPFHSEKTPSFTVSEEKQIYHCFGCHSGGNVFKFLMEYEKISFVESVQELAEKLGIQLEVEENVNTEFQNEQEILYDINTEAAKYFSNNLLNDSEGQIARDYFQKRNIKLQNMRAFGLGYALNGWENLVNFLHQKKIDLEKALQLGLISRSKDGRIFDTLPGRIIFPIFSPNGRVVAFAGRKLRESDGGGKYINSPESAIYVKGKILYGLSHAKDDIRKLNKAILVEGYMDLISLYQNGIKNVVAVSGTALTEDQVLLLSRYTKNVVLLFDADTAGIKASMRSIELLLKKEFEIKIASLPAGEDPDSFVNKFGKEKFEDFINRAQNFLEYQTAYYDSQGMFNDPATMTEAIRELVKTIAWVSDELKQSVMIKSIARNFNLRFNLIENELIKLKQTTINRINSPTYRKDGVIDVKEDNFILKLINQIEHYGNTESDLIKYIFSNDQKVVEYLYNLLNSNDFENPDFIKIFVIAINEVETRGQIELDTVLNKIEDENIKKLLRITVIEKYSVSYRWDNNDYQIKNKDNFYKSVYDTIVKLKGYKYDEELNILRSKIESANDDNERFNLMKELNSLLVYKKEYLQNIPELR